MSMTFEQYVEYLQKQNPTSRTLRFEYEDKSYWLKQAETVEGTQRFLKPFAQQAFRNEVNYLLDLQKKSAPIPRIYLANDKVLVLEDSGKPIGYWLEDNNLTAQQKQQILNDAVQALVNLHNMDLTHGRPLLKDILWQDGKVTFIDFEMRSKSNNLFGKKVRDTLFFLYGICREPEITRQQIQQTFLFCKQQMDQKILSATLARIKLLLAFYYILLPFKKVARTDLKGFYLLMENRELLS